MRNYVVKTTENGLSVEINTQRMKLLKESNECTQDVWFDIVEKYKTSWNIELFEETPKQHFMVYGRKNILLLVHDYGFEVVWEMWVEKKTKNKKQ